jgi:hypothetical protein
VEFPSNALSKSSNYARKSRLKRRKKPKKPRLLLFLQKPLEI